MSVNYSSPKDAVEVLFQLKPQAYFYITKLGDKNTVTLTVDQNKYAAEGITEDSAEQLVAEMALKDLFFDMILSMSLSTNPDDDVSQYKSANWQSLTSYALFKLMKEWLLFYQSNDSYKHQCKAYLIKKKSIESKSNAKCDNVKDLIETSNTKCDVNVNKIADKSSKCTSVNPIVYLNRMLRKNLVFKESLHTDKKMFVSSLTIDGVIFKGMPSMSKKGARQLLAEKVLLEKYNIHF